MNVRNFRLHPRIGDERELLMSPSDQYALNPTMVRGGALNEYVDNPKLYPDNAYPQGQGVLTNSSQPISQSGILAQQQQGGNMRGSTRLPAVPRQKINMMGEGNMRMAGAGLGALGANMTGNEAIAAAAQEYGAMKDYNRQAEADALALEEDRRLAMDERIADNPPATNEELQVASDGLEELNDMIAALEKGGLTGPLDGTVKAWLDESGISDKFIGDNQGANRAYWRQRLENYRVSEALKLVAQTKGAISEREMDLFLKPVPSTAMTTEETWLIHLRKRQAIAIKLQEFLRNKGTGNQATNNNNGFAFVD